MQSYYALTFAALVAIAQAITITSPSKDGSWDLSKSQTITWTSVSTDPQTVDIYLAHMASNPPLNDKLFSNIDVSKGSVSVSGLQLPTGSDYQINFVTPNQPDEIKAQSQQFNVTGQAASASSTLAGYTGSASSTGTSSGSSSTGTATTTKTDSSSSGSATGMATSVSSGASSKSASAAASGSSSSSKSGAMATGVPMVGLLAGAVAALL